MIQLVKVEQPLPLFTSLGTARRACAAVLARLSEGSQTVNACRERLGKSENNDGESDPRHVASASSYAASEVESCTQRLAMQGSDGCCTWRAASKSVTWRAVAGSHPTDSITLVHEACQSWSFPQVQNLHAYRGTKETHTI